MQNYKRRDIDIILKRNGWYPHHQTGSHLIYKNDRGQHVTIGLCKCNGAVIHKLIKRNNIVV